MLPCASNGLPNPEAARTTPWVLFGLSPGGVYRAGPVTRPPVRSYRTFSPLPARPKADLGGVFSVALSLGLPPVGVTHRRVLWSPDFPPSTSARGFGGQRPPACPAYIIRFDGAAYEWKRFRTPAGKSQEGPSTVPRHPRAACGTICFHYLSYMVTNWLIFG